MEKTSDLKLLRLPEVLHRFPVSRSAWWLGVKENRYPAPIKIGKRSVAWQEADIDVLIRKCLDSSKEFST